MITVFDGIPDIFVEHYDAQFVTWAQEFRERGKSCAIVFDVLPGQFPTIGVNDEVVWKGAWLVAEIEKYRGRQVMMIRPATEWDRNLIEVHAWNLKRTS